MVRQQQHQQNNNNNRDDDNKTKTGHQTVHTQWTHHQPIYPLSRQSVASLTDTVDGNTNSSSSSPPLVGVPHTSSPDVAAELEHSSPEDVVLGSGGESPQAGCCWVSAVGRRYLPQTDRQTDSRFSYRQMPLAQLSSHSSAHLCVFACATKEPDCSSIAWLSWPTLHNGTSWGTKNSGHISDWPLQKLISWCSLRK